MPAFEGDIASQTTGNALRTILHYNYISISRDQNSLLKQITAQGINPTNYVSFCSLRQNGELLNTPITELIYIHSKLMIVDDRTIICGSANINDRSLLGSRDSEMAIIIEDTEFIEINFNQKLIQSGKLTGKLRMQLMSDHLDCDLNLVQDCISDHFWKNIWLRIASKNTKIFDETFLCIPTDNVTTMEDNIDYLNKKRPLAETDKFGALQKVQDLQGYLVLLPLHYLENENLSPSVFVKEGIVPTMLWT